MFDLSLADAKFVGEADCDTAGWSVSGAGDVNQDGLDDVIIGAINNDAGGIDSAGAAYLIYGSASGLTGTMSLSVANAKFLGETTLKLTGWSVSNAGDIDQDGFDDLIISAPLDLGSSNRGAAYLFYGPVK